jgi:hypothetical protein
MSVVIRLATSDDIPRLAELWHEKMVLWQHADARFVLPSDAVSRWSQAALVWLEDERCVIYLAEKQGVIVGFVVGWLQIEPVLIWQPMGVISEVGLDAHNYHGGVARSLLQTIQGWFAERGVENVVAYVPHFYAVEQAFWRSVGAVQLLDVMWIKS